MTDVQRAGLSRRELMHRTGIVGGALVGSALIQTVTAPGVSASVGGEPTPAALALTTPLPTRQSGVTYPITIQATGTPNSSIPSGTVHLRRGLPTGLRVQAAQATLDGTGAHTFSVTAGEPGKVERYFVEYDGDTAYTGGDSNPVEVTVIPALP